MILADLALGLFTNLVSDFAITPLLRPDLAERGMNAIPGALEAALRRSADDFGEANEHAPWSDDEWRELLEAGEVRAAIELLFLARVDEGSVDLDDVRSIFAVAIQRTQQRVEALVGIDSDRMFNQLLRAGSEILAVAVRENSVSAADARAELRHKLVLAELRRLRDELFATRDALPEPELAYLHQEVGQRMWLRTMRIDLPNILRHESVEIDRLYVEPAFAPTFERPEIQAPTEGELSYVSVVSTCRRRVVLGNPGAGKSTLAMKICHDLALPSRVIGSRLRSVVPLLIDLRRLYASGQSLGGLGDEMIGKLLLRDVSPGTFVSMLLRRRTFVIFDGLDEVVATDARREVRSLIEAFAREFPAADVLVMSREIAYDEAPLNPAEFDHVRIEPFDRQRVERYARNWFALDRHDAVNDAAQVDAFMAETTGDIAELCTIPLMLALLCSLYRGRGWLPDNIPDVYEQCSLLLFETWDRSRGVPVDVSFSRHIQPALRELAFWILSHEELGRGLTRRQTETRVADYLRRWRYPDPAETLAAAREFVDFCRGRSWVFQIFQAAAPPAKTSSVSRTERFLSTTRRCTS